MKPKNNNNNNNFRKYNWDDADDDNNPGITTTYFEPNLLGLNDSIGSVRRTGKKTVFPPKLEAPASFQGTKLREIL